MYFGSVQSEGNPKVTDLHFHCPKNMVPVSREGVQSEGISCGDEQRTIPPSENKGQALFLGPTI